MDRIGRASVGLGAIVALALGALSWTPVRRVQGSVRMLTELARPLTAVTAGAPIGTTDVIVREGSLSARARLYHPRAAVHRCLVVGHGVHYLGIDEPRLTRFARTLAGVGVEVLTPELTDLADYRVTRAGADVLGAATRYLAGRCPRRNGIGLLGFSFAGGLALLAAGDPRTQAELAYVTSIGGYDDLERVLRFLVTGVASGPDGPVLRTPHEYGLVVLLYEYLDHFVPEVDRPVAARAIRAWLEEERARAWAEASRSTTLETEQLFVQLASGRISELAPAIGAVVEKHTVELDALSPRNHLREIPGPIYLLHGSGDSVIPPEETLWADRELGARPHIAIVTPLIEHVEMSAKPSLREQLELVRFMARLL